MILIIFLISLPLVTPYLRGDGSGYYSYINSLITDGDLDFRDEYTYADEWHYSNRFDENGNIRSQYHTKTGKIANKYSVGPSILWSPFFVAAHAFVHLHNAIRPGSPIATDGFSRPYLLLCAIGTSIYGLVGLLLCYLMAKKLFGGIPALISVISIWFASSLTVYMYFLPYLSHVLSAFACSLFVWLWIRTYQERKAKDWILLGLTGGLMFIIYYINIIFFIFVVFDFIEMIKAKKARALGVGLALFSLFFIAGTLPLFIAKYIIYGFPPIVGYERDWHFASPRLIKVLISSEHGLWTWTPAIFFACIGFIPLIRRHKAIGWRSLATFVIFWYVISSWGSWHGQSSFGNRFFISLTPIFILGLAAGLNYLLDILKALPRKLKLSLLGIAAAIFIIWNLGFIFQWGANMIPNRGPISWNTMIRNQFTVVPQRAVHLAKGFFTSRTDIIKKIEKQDMEEIKQYKITR